MEWKDAELAVDQILHEECQRPTIHYDDIANEWVQRCGELSPDEIEAWKRLTQTPRKNLWAQRKDTVRDVTETPHIYRLGGVNYDLLENVYGRLAQQDQSSLIDHLLRRVAQGGMYVFRRPETYSFPSFDGSVSELPLVAEFLIRTGNADMLFHATGQATLPTVSLAVMLIALEETFALQWSLFTNDQLGHVSAWLIPLREIADKQTYSSRGTRGNMVDNPAYRPGRQREANQIVQSIDRIEGYCQRARFFHLKGNLRQNTNIEVENDKSTVEEFLSRLGFSANLMSALNEAEKEFRTSASPFELKNSLIHFRGFLEHLHLEAARYVAKTIQGSVHDWDTATAFLRKHGFITAQQEKFARGIYALISDEGVHPLMPERAFARVLRNVIIEYGLIFLTIMNGKGMNHAS